MDDRTQLLHDLVEHKGHCRAEFDCRVCPVGTRIYGDTCWPIEAYKMAVILVNENRDENGSCESIW